jgi:hypothetical protein
VEHAVAVRGGGTAVVPAYGLADAEHQVEKEIREAWPDAAVQVLDVARPSGPPRIVEDFAVTYRVHGTITVDADSAAAAPRAAFRVLRGLFDGTRYRDVRWEPVSPTDPPATP